MVIVAWLVLWSFGNDVGGGSVVVGDGSARGCGDGGVVGGGGDRGCGDLVVVGVVVIWGAKLVVVMVVEIWLVQNNDRKRKTYLKGSQPGEHEEFPLNNGGEIYLNINLAA